MELEVTWVTCYVTKHLLSYKYNSLAKRTPNRLKLSGEDQPAADFE